MALITILQSRRNFTFSSVSSNFSLNSSVLAFNDSTCSFKPSATHKGIKQRIRCTQIYCKINSFDNTVLVYDLNVIPWHHMNHWSSCKHLAMPVKKENDLIRNTGSILGMPKLTLDTALPFLFKDAISLTRSMSTTFVVNVLIKMALCLLSCLLSLTAWIKTKLITKKFSNAAK